MIAGKDGIVFQKEDGSYFPLPRKFPLPYEEIPTLNIYSDSFWIGTTRGLIHLIPGDHPTVEYLAGQRWLPDDKVTGIGFQSYWVGWVETPKGYSRIEYKHMTLADKSKTFVERVQKRHVRWGMTSDSHLKVPGDLSSNQMVSSDNDGLWTQMYIAAEAFRYAVTKAADARANAKVGFEAMLRLEAITGISGFHARSIIKVAEDIQPKDGEWHDTPDGKWRWKGDTSSDEIVGHYFGYAVYYDLVADEAERQKIRSVITRMTDHILNNSYQLIDVDGKRTRWGWWGPDAIWEDPDELGLRALHMLAHLRTAHHITGNPRYQQAYEELISKHRYHLLMRNQKINYPGRINHSDDELAFLSYYPLLAYEKDAKLRAVYVESLERSWQVERPERNPLWNFIYAAGSGAKEFDRRESIRTLREIPMDLIEWTVTNSHRLDVPMDLLADRFSRKQALIVLPYDELPMTKWNGNPYRIDGGNGGRSED
ncbi:MAG: transcriptional regulator, partial [Blastocatellia bacterium]